MSTNLQTLKGFRDFLGPQARARFWLKNKVSAVFERFGFEPWETPALEYASLLSGKYGEEAEKLLYKFTDRGGREVALRYDQTVPSARVIAQNKGALTFPYKRYQIQPVWRADKPQKGRYREFYQCDADVFGTDSLAADAEILAVCYAIYKEIGLTSVILKVNDRQALISSIESAGVAKEMIFSVIQTIDKLDKLAPEQVAAELENKVLTKEVIEKLFANLSVNFPVIPTERSDEESPADAGSRIREGSFDSAQDDNVPESLQTIIDQAVAFGIPREAIVYTPTLARGLDYYTGLIFEAIVPEAGNSSCAGGGRYDNLINDLSGVQMQAVGFALGYDRTLEVAEQLGKIPSFACSATVLVTIFSPELAITSTKVAQKLREAGVSTELYLSETIKLEKQLKYAAAKQIPFVIIIGPDEADRGVVKLKNMETGEQKEMTVEEIIPLLSSNVQ